MIVINARNVHEALPRGLEYLYHRGEQRDTRNGSAIVSPEPVTTVYTRPWERVVFHPWRDANPFFHLYEAMWMLAGRDDVAGVARYARQMLEYSDDGHALHGAYGERWRGHFGFDQLLNVERELRASKDSRRAVLQMWDASVDGRRPGKDYPCNLAATFQIANNKMEMVVFCRSNDVVWGAYGANAVHFSFLQEYMAKTLDCEVGDYTHVSVNYHAYQDHMNAFAKEEFNKAVNPYDGPSGLKPLRLELCGQVTMQKVCAEADETAANWAATGQNPFRTDWLDQILKVLRAHAMYKQMQAPERYKVPIQYLRDHLPANLDWAVAARQWLERRRPSG